MTQHYPPVDVLTDVSTAILDEAIDSICELYRADLERKPSKFELRDMLEFVLAPRYDLIEAQNTTDIDIDIDIA